MSAITTGNPIVDHVGQMSFSGNVIPQAWYHTIRKPNGKPNLRAILFLSDIVYWYRPLELRDEATGALIGRRKKFKADLLQRGYRQLADQFGCSKGEAQSTIVDLENLGVVRRVFRTETRGGVTCSNVLYLALDCDTLRALTFPNQEALPVEQTQPMPVEEPVPEQDAPPASMPDIAPAQQSDAPPLPKFRGTLPGNSGTPSLEISPDPPSKFQSISTENTTEISTEITHLNPSIHPSVAKTPKDEWSAMRLRQIADDALWQQRTLPRAFLQDEPLLEAALQLLTGCCPKTPPDGEGDFAHRVRALFCEALLGMLTAKSPMLLHKTQVTAARVYDRLVCCIAFDETEGCHIDGLQSAAVDAFLGRVASRQLPPVKNHLGYMQACIWRALQVGDIADDVLIWRDFGCGAG